MLIGKYYDGIEINRLEKIIFVKLLLPHRVLSTCRAGGGMQDDLEYIYNHQSCEPTGHMGSSVISAVKDPREYRRVICTRYGLPHGACATLGTAANMNMAAVVAERFHDLEVVAVCTGGVETNAGRVGDPASVYESEGGFERLDHTGKIVEEEFNPDNGTINTMVFINKELSSGAMVRVVVTATEAKTAVLQELAVNSRYSNGLATGTGTDQIVVASLCGTGKLLTSAGKHSKLGELIGKSVCRAIKKTLALQNGLTPARQCSAQMHLERFGATRGRMMSGIGKWLTPEDDRLLMDNYDCIDRDPVTVAAVAALVHLKDKITWGVLPVECRHEIMGGYAAQVAASVSGKYENLPHYREVLVSAKDETRDRDFLDLVCRAMAFGFSEKWN
jgi:adenosylcobinamide amidohydrolase